MKNKLVAIILVLTLIITGCSINIIDSTKDTEQKEVSSSSISELNDNSSESDTLKFTGMNDSKLLTYVEDNVYQSLVDSIDSNKYYVENVEAIYISQEYINDLTYNSQENVFFGYSLSELNKQFKGKKYVFNVNDAGKTKVEEFEEYDDTYDQIIKNVAIGMGVILVCVTVSVVTGGAGLPAVAMIFAGAAKGATTFALSSAAIGGTISTAVSYYQTGDMNKALKEGTLSASEEFKWGAILGGVTQGIGSLVKLKGMTKSGLTMNQVAKIQKASKYPTDILKMIRTPKEADIYVKEAGLVAKNVNGKRALVKEFTPEILNYKREVAGQTMTNLEAMKKGYAAIDPMTEEAFELHHIGQKVDSPLAVLTKKEHTGKINNSILHDSNITNGDGVHSKISNTEWAKQRSEFWKAFAELFK